MKQDKSYKKFYTKLVFEGWINALVRGLTVGFGVNFIVALIMLFVDGNGLLLSLIAFGVASILSTPIFYLLCFKPTKKSLAQRIDNLGLEERLITMLEYEQDDSYMARRQREDAKKALDDINQAKTKIPFSLSIVAIIVLCVSMLFGGAMTTVTTLADYDIIMIGGGEDLQEYWFMVEFTCEGEGEILGEFIQEIKEGEDGLTVETISLDEEKWIFAGWFDYSLGYVPTDAKPLSEEFYFTPQNVIEDMVICAVYQESEGDENEEKQEQPPPPDEPPNPEEPPTNDPPLPNTEGDKVIDNETDYPDVIGEYIAMWEERIANGESVPDYIREIIDQYYASIG